MSPALHFSLCWTKMWSSSLLENRKVKNVCVWGTVLSLVSEIQRPYSKWLLKYSWLALQGRVACWEKQNRNNPQNNKTQAESKNINTGRLRRCLEFHDHSSSGPWKDDWLLFPDSSAEWCYVAVRVKLFQTVKNKSTGIFWLAAITWRVFQFPSLMCCKSVAECLRMKV